MVKFGRHLSFFKSEQQYEESSHYVIPYNYLREKIDRTTSSTKDNLDSNDLLPSKRPDTSLWHCLLNPTIAKPTTEESFAKAWHGALTFAGADFTRATRTCWRTIYGAISDLEEARGAPLEMALQLYTPHVGVNAARDMLVALKSILATAKVNAEGLRKLVKKYDKHPKGSNGGRLSEVLLPDLYGSVVAVGQGTVEMAVEIIRCIIEDVEFAREEQEESKENNGDLHANQAYTETTAPLNDTNRPPSPKSITNPPPDPLPTKTSVSQLPRSTEYQWLHSFTSSLPSPTLLDNLVAHRGFHDPAGPTNRRPIENSLAAFEAAWSSGIHLCECDVALTRDEKIVIAHDENFSRLALDTSANEGCAMKAVRDLTLKELIALTLRDGARAPLLIDVLRSAAMIGGNARLVIEIKPGNTDVAAALARLMGRYPEIMERVALIMSFDLWCMHQLSSELSRVAVQLGLGATLGGGVAGKQSISMFQIGSSGNLSINRNSMGMLGPHRSSMGSSTGLTIGSYPSNGFLPSSLGQAFPSNGMLAQSYDSMSHMLTMDEKDEPVSSSGDDSKTSSNQTLPEMLPPQSIPSKLSRAPSPQPPPPPLPTYALPDLMLLTVASAPEHPAELWMDIEDTSPVDGWLKINNGGLDGIYVRYQAKMKEPEGAAALKALSERYKVGVWLMRGEDPDDLETLKYLTEECGVAYFNSDLPRNFFEKRMEEYF